MNCPQLYTACYAVLHFNWLRITECAEIICRSNPTWSTPRQYIGSTYSHEWRCAVDYEASTCLHTVWSCQMSMLSMVGMIVLCITVLLFTSRAPADGKPQVNHLGRPDLTIGHACTIPWETRSDNSCMKNGRGLRYDKWRYSWMHRLSYTQQHKHKN